MFSSLIHSLLSCPSFRMQRVTLSPNTRWGHSSLTSTFVHIAVAVNALVCAGTHALVET